MLVTLRELLNDAEIKNYAVGAFNCPTLESARAAIEAAEELQVPVILSHAEVHFEITPLEIMGPILINLAKKATVPVTVHLDHGSCLENIKKAIDIGFTSVMIDGSHLNFEENVRIVKEVVEYASKKNVSVEAELGMMTSSGLGGEETSGEALNDSVDIYTDPEIAKDFVERTQIDGLAASFGTVHGIYLKEPKLDFDRLQKIHRNIQRPVVMHGGSGLNEEDYIRAINAGVRKINYYSYAAMAGAEAVKEYIETESHHFYHDCVVVAKDAMKKDIKNAMRIFSN
ncbi:class II fructose-bisphosphate aldolase [Robertmurraya sp. Marseille-Q9965]